MSRAPNNNKQPCSCQTSLRNLLFHLVQRISLHFKSPDLYLFCTTKVFPKFLLPFQSQASFQSEQFGSYDYAPRSLSLVACSLSSQRSRMLMQKRPLFVISNWCVSIRQTVQLPLTAIATFCCKNHSLLITNIGFTLFFEIIAGDCSNEFCGNLN